MGNCLQPSDDVVAYGRRSRQPGQFVIAHKVYASKFKSTYQTLCTVTIPAAETKSIGLPADAQLSWFLHRHLDNFIMT